MAKGRLVARGRPRREGGNGEVLNSEAQRDAPRGDLWRAQSAGVPMACFDRLPSATAGVLHDPWLADGGRCSKVVYLTRRLWV